VLQCVAVCCSVLQCVAVRCSVLQCVALYAENGPGHELISHNQASMCVACCRVSQCGLQSVAVCVAVSCSVCCSEERIFCKGRLAAKSA